LLRHRAVGLTLGIAGLVVFSGALVSCGGGGGSGGGGASIPAGPIPIVSLSISISGSPTVGTPGVYSVIVTGRDGGGNVITGAYTTPVTLADSDTTGATHLSTTNVPNGSTAVTLSYNGMGGSPLGGFQGATITGTAGTPAANTAFLPIGLTCTTFPGVSGYYPCDLADAYSLPTQTGGAGQTVAIVDAFDDPNAEADLGVYRTKFGIAACTTANGCFRKLNQAGQQGPYPTGNTGWAEEISLDLDMVSAICPLCHIILVEAGSNSNGNLYIAENEAASLGGVNAISNSWGGGEYPSETSDETTYFNHPGIMITVSSGDGGYGVQFPASSRFVTAVGGTSLNVASNGRGWAETVWSGAGSGCSAYETKPSWQVDSGCSKRMVTDVAAVANPSTGVAVYDTYGESGWLVFGGTSVASPIVASVYALAGNAASLNYASQSYANTGELNDVTSGSNGTCSPSPAYFCNGEVGYDGPTGNGTPNGTGGLTPFAIRTQSTRTGPWRNVILPAAGTPTERACSMPQPGQMACMAILVL